MKTYAFTGGGTGGHIYPGLAVAAALKEISGARIIWLGSESALDRNIVESAGLEFFAIKSGKLRRYFSLKNISDIFNIIAGFFEAKKIIKQEKCTLLFSKGGFVSVPPCAASYVLRIPVITHESDFSPGLATRINAHFAKKICLSYGVSSVFFPKKARGKTIHTGNPVRAEFRSARREDGLQFLKIALSEKVLLALGGSQGAKEINSLIRSSLPFLTEHFTVVHQTGEADFAESASLASEKYKPYPYFKDEMPGVHASAFLVVSRAGAGVVWESAALWKPMVLIPLAGSGTRGDQVENARLFTGNGAALTLVHPSPDEFTQTLTQLLANPKEIERMSRASAEIGKLDAARNIAALIEEISGA